MKKLYILLSLAIILFSNACTKDVAFPEQEEGQSNDPQTIIDTVFPLSYLPIYPGSWWQYVHTMGTDTLYGLTSSGYLLKSWQDGFGTNGYHKAYLPAHVAFDSNPNTVVDTFGCYVEYKKITWYGEIGYYNGVYNPYYIAVNDTLPAGSVIETNWGTGWYNMKTIFAKDTTVVVNSVSFYPVIVVRRESGISMGTPLDYNYYYYAKDVGLIKKIYVSLTSSATDTTNLISYYINQ